MGMMKIKRIICIISIVAMICMTAACGGNDNSSADIDVDDNGNGGGNISIDTGRDDGNDDNGDDSSGDGGGDNSDNGDSSDNSSGSGSDASNGSDNEVVQPTQPKTPEEILTGIETDIRSSGAEMPMTLPPSGVTADLSQNTIGLSEGDFNRLVDSASSNMAAIGTFAHQIIVIKAKDAGSATEVKKLVSGDNGYDSKKWICVFPEKTVVVESGSYVLIAASYKEVTEAAIEAFKKITGSIGSVNTIWEFAE